MTTEAPEQDNCPIVSPILWYESREGQTLILDRTPRTFTQISKYQCRLKIGGPRVELKCRLRSPVFPTILTENISSLLNLRVHKPLSANSSNLTKWLDLCGSFVGEKINVGQLFIGGASLAQEFFLGFVSLQRSAGLPFAVALLQISGEMCL